MIGVQVYQDYKEHTIKVVVADNGCGIKAEDLPKVKDKFYKANRKINGSGIGATVNRSSSMESSLLITSTANSPTAELDINCALSK